MNRINFNSIFRLNNDGSIEPRQLIRIGRIQMGPGVRLHRGVLFGDLNLYDSVGRDFRTDQEDGVLVLTGVYG